MSIEKVIAAVVDTKLLTLYRPDGSTIEIPQGDPRVRSIIAQVMPIVQAGGTAEVDLTALPNAYKDFEEKSSGVVRLFRVMKKAVASIFAPPEEVTEIIEAGGTVGTIPPAPQSAVTMAAVDEIISQADSVSDPDYKDSDTTDQHTMIAVVKSDEGKDTIIPGVEAIKPQFGYAGGRGSTKGMENFMRRLANVIDKRPHSVEDLLKFLEKGDLPIADDGCIVAYKLLYADNNVFVDPHSRKVTQRPGSYVCVDESLVDLSRRNECSNGLHIGRRGYMGNFHGDSMFMCKIAPEDVMVVPHGDPNKVRVKGYHIVAQVNSKAFSLISANRPATTDTETANLLSKVIAGKHAAPDQEVRITQQKGGGLKIRPIVNGKVQQPIEEATASTEKHHALDDGTAVTADPKEVATQVATAKGTNSRQAKARELMDKATKGDRQAATDLLAHKKACKVSWDSLGISPQEVEDVTAWAKGVLVPEPASEAPKATPVTQETIDKIVPAQPKGSTQISARSLFEQKKWGPLYDLKKAKKKSWQSLGFNVGEIKIITNNNPTSSQPEPVAEPKAKAEPVKAAPPAKLDISNAPSAMETGQQQINRKSNRRQTEARQHFNAQHWTHLVNLKRKAKVGWAALGFSQKEIDEIKLHIGD